MQVTADRLRKIVLARPAGTQIGSLRELAATLEVGIVTVQQVARVLEHEGLLLTKRGTRGGGYYGARPDGAALERAFAAWLSVHEADTYETLEMNSLLYTELIARAARCTEDALFEELHVLEGEIHSCDTIEKKIAFERRLNDLLFRMTKRPLMELLTRVTVQYYSTHGTPFQSNAATKTWENGRRRIIQAVLQRDEVLARFEADRHRNNTLALLQSALTRTP